MGRADALKPSRHKGSHPPLARAELPVDKVSLARFLIGMILVREMVEGVGSGYTRLAPNAQASRYPWKHKRWGISGVNYDAAFRNIVRGVVLAASGAGSPDQGN
jgi:hypothetical protein